MTGSHALPRGARRVVTGARPRGVRPQTHAWIRNDEFYAVSMSSGSGEQILIFGVASDVRVGVRAHGAYLPAFATGCI